MSIVFLWLAFRDVDLADVWLQARSVAFGWLALSIVTKLASVLCLSLRSQVFLRPLAPFRLPEVVRSHLLGFLGNAVLPFRLGELMRVDYLARQAGVSRMGVIAVVGFERVMDVFCILVILAAVSPVMASELVAARSLPIFAGTVLAAIVAGWTLSRFPSLFLGIGRAVIRRFGGRIEALVEPRLVAFVGGFSALNSPRRFLAVLGWSFGYWLVQALGVTLWFQAFDLEIPWYGAFVVLVFIALGAAIPSSPGFVGTYDYFAMRGLLLFGVGEATAASFALVGHAMAIVPLSVVAVLALLPELRRAWARAAKPAAVSVEEEPSSLEG